MSNFKLPDYGSIKPATAGNSGGDINLNFSIANLNGGQEGANQMFSIIANNLKKVGKW